jgi:hypothetical protein
VKERILFFTPYLTTRLRYVLDWLFSEHYPIDFACVCDTNSIPHDSLVINYSDQYLGDGFKAMNIKPCGLLFEKQINYQINTKSIFEKLKTSGDSSFDIFSAIFFMLSRYEEYVVKNRDKYGRFSITDAANFGEFSWQVPICDIWASDLIVKMNEFFGLNLSHRKKYCFLPTIDVDIPYAYRFKGLFRTIGSLVKKLFNAHFTDLYHHLLFLIKGGKDPFDTYEWIADTIGLNPYVYFIHLGNYGGNDNTLNWQNIRLRKHFIDSLKGNYELGIHPSLLSNKNPQKLCHEIEVFELLTGKKPTLSRHHYLAITLPETYRLLIRHGIEKDFSLGYVETIGFRAGTCSPFKWFDLEKNEITSLWLYPQTFMDRTIFDYMKCSYSEAQHITRQHINIIKKYNGVFSPIWHNSTVLFNKEYKELFFLTIHYGI